MAVEALHSPNQLSVQDFYLWEAELEDYEYEPRHDRLRVELVSEFVEALPVQFVTQYELEYRDDQVVDGDGRSLSGMCYQELGRAQWTAARDLRHAFYVGRAEADLKLVERVDNQLMKQEAGTTLITFSPFPSHPYEDNPEAVRDRNYRPEQRRGLVWLHRKLDDGRLQLTSLAVDGKSFEQHRDMFAKFTDDDTPLAATSEQLPHMSAQLKLDDDSFDQLLVGLKDWAGIDEELDSIVEIERYGSDVVERVYSQQRATEDALSGGDLPLHLVANVNDLLRDNPQRLLASQIEPSLLAQAVQADSKLNDNHKQALKRAALLAGFSTVLLRLNSGENQSQKAQLELTDEMGTSGRIFIAEQELYGCGGSMADRFGAGINGNLLKDWGKDTGPGTCKDCKQQVEQRGGCEICIDCHVKHQAG